MLLQEVAIANGLGLPFSDTNLPPTPTWGKSHRMSNPESRNLAKSNVSGMFHPASAMTPGIRLLTTGATRPFDPLVTAPTSHPGPPEANRCETNQHERMTSGQAPCARQSSGLPDTHLYYGLAQVAVIYGMEDATLDILRRNGFTSAVLLCHLQPADLPWLIVPGSISLAQKLALRSLITASSTVNTLDHARTPPAVHGRSAWQMAPDSTLLHDLLQSEPPQESEALAQGNLAELDTDSLMYLQGGKGQFKHLDVVDIVTTGQRQNLMSNDG